LSVKKAVIGAAVKKRMAKGTGTKKRRLTEKEWENRVKWIGGSLLVVGASYAGYSIWKANKDKREIRDREKYQINGHNLDQAAIEVYDAFFNQDIFGATECEQCAIDAIIDIPKQYINQVALLYNKKYSKNLYEDFRKYLNQQEYAQVDHLLN